MRRALAPAALLVTVALAGCGASEDTPAPTETVTVTQTPEATETSAPSETPTAPETPAETPAPDELVEPPAPVNTPDDFSDTTPDEEPVDEPTADESPEEDLPTAEPEEPVGETNDVSINVTSDGSYPLEIRYTKDADDHSVSETVEATGSWSAEIPDADPWEDSLDVNVEWDTDPDMLLLDDAPEQTVTCETIIDGTVVSSDTSTGNLGYITCYYFGG